MTRFHIISTTLEEALRGRFEGVEISDDSTLIREVAESVGQLSFFYALDYPPIPPSSSDALLFPSGHVVIRVPCAGEGCPVCEFLHFVHITMAQVPPEPGYYIAGGQS